MLFKKDKPKQLKAPTGPSHTDVAKAKPTQEMIPFCEIRDGVLIMRDASLRRVLSVSSLNFSLKSEEEQNGIIEAYMAFLNTMDFEVQIVVQSRPLNIEKYLEKLDTVARQQENELLRKQTISYRSFIKRLVEDANIMDKKFYVVITHNPQAKKKKTFFTRLSVVISPAKVVKIKQEKFAKYMIELDRRVAVVEGGLRAMGLETEALDTQGLIELYYNTYNPITSQTRRIEDLEALQVDQTIV